MNHAWILLLLAITSDVIGSSCLRLSPEMTKQLPSPGQLVGIATITAGVIIVNLRGKHP